ncbi:sensor histidine kinase [Nocardiopsis ganjiahuensis]|uniref:sensor histidine kinase n=1 Tax=Nocardiopsis ganjiahuensis TaxID=239984 RepID=UPI000346A18A|nr:histidine kinase [Nocardiopsis ganjiahuensis]
MTVRTLRAAITLAPHRFLLSSWPWRALAYVLAGAAGGVLLFGSVQALSVVWPGALRQWYWETGLVVLCLVLIPASTPLVARWGRFCEGLIGDPLEPPRGTGAPPGPRGERPGPASPRLWRDVGYTVLSLTVLCLLDVAVLTVALGVPLTGVLSYIDSDQLNTAERWATLLGWASLWLVGLYLVAGWAAARSEIARAVLSPREERLAAELRAVTTSRAALAEAFDEERRRIERDLHDGAQQRLVAVKTSLGLAELDLPPGSPAAGAVREAREQVSLALGDLRDLVRGIYPQVLTERGLPAALWDVAARSGSSVEIDLDLPGRLPGPVESTAYFVVCEAIANAAKHAPGAPVRVYGTVVDGTLRVEVTDDGPGGAGPDGGGLSGLRNRLAVLSGRLTVDSPEGGPTTVRLEIPE